MALPIGTSVPIGNMVDGPMGQIPEYVAGPVQLHTSTDANLNRIVGEESLPPDFSNPQFVMVAEWDGVSRYVICHKGNYSTLNGLCGMAGIDKGGMGCVACS
jgi:hypothetical protein